MNDIEKMFFETYEDIWDRSSQENIGYAIFDLIPQVKIGVYLVDFVYRDCAIEIDGHKYHKTKEQREKDYKKTRYLIKEGYHVIRFMGTEVFIDPLGCVMEMVKIADLLDRKEIKSWFMAVEHGKELVRKCQTES